MTDSKRLLARDRKLRMYRARASEALRRRDNPSALPPSPQAPPDPGTDPGPSTGVGWDYDAHAARRPQAAPQAQVSISSQVLSLLADPTVTAVTITSAARALDQPRSDVATAIAALVQSGELVARGTETGKHYMVTSERKYQLETLYRDTAEELGETTALVPVNIEAQMMAVQDDVPRLPVTAGLLSLFLPGTGQLLNGDIARASLIFAVWSLAFLTHLAPIWIFVALYAGAEAFFTAKLRGLERELSGEPEPPNNEPEPRPTGGAL